MKYELTRCHFVMYKCSYGRHHKLRMHKLYPSLSNFQQITVSQLLYSDYILSLSAVLLPSKFNSFVKHHLCFWISIKQRVPFGSVGVAVMGLDGSQEGPGGQIITIIHPSPKPYSSIQAIEKEFMNETPKCKVLHHSSVCQKFYFILSFKFQGMN